LERRLAAIVSADVVGYSRLIRVDEEGTLLALRALREELIDPAIKKHRGRIVKLMGDGILVEFASVVDAVACSAEVQLTLAEREPGKPEIVFRVGVNLGDVVIDGEDIQGDGVNVAARLETLSEPGGMCISDAVHEQVRDRLAFNFEDAGKQEIKNIDRPVRVWKWSAAKPVTDTSASSATKPLRQPEALPLPDKPSIAVLAFDNISNDPEQEYFADGIAEDVITALARARDLFVIARNSSFSYRGQASDMRQIGRELGVRYLLEGSVRRAGERVRVTAQLIEADSGNHIWAERYDRPVTDIFAVQDEITINVAGAIGSEIRTAEIRNAALRSAEGLASWEHLMKANWHLYRVTPEDTVEAQNICRRLIKGSGENSMAYAVLCFSYAWDLIYGWGERTPKETIEMAVQTGKAAIELDSKNELAHAILSMVYWVSGYHEAGIREGETAVALNPNHTLAHAQLGCSLGFSGTEYHARAIEHTNQAIRLGPRDIWVHWPHSHLGLYAIMAGRYEEAIEHGRAALDHNPAHGTGHRVVAAALALSSRLDEARAAYDEATRVQPLDMKAYSEQVHRMFRKSEDAERYIEALQLAGARTEV
jgi:adenylate cyclase